MKNSRSEMWWQNLELLKVRRSHLKSRKSSQRQKRAMRAMKICDHAHQWMLENQKSNKSKQKQRRQLSFFGRSVNTSLNNSSHSSASPLPGLVRVRSMASDLRELTCSWQNILLTFRVFRLEMYFVNDVCTAFLLYGLSFIMMTGIARPSNRDCFALPISEHLLICSLDLARVLLLIRRPVPLIGHTFPGYHNSAASIAQRLRCHGRCIQDDTVMRIGGR